MANTFDDVLNAAAAAGLKRENFSDYDWNLAQSNPDFGLSMVNLKKDYGTASTDEQRALINAAANALRKSSGGYTADSSGLGYYRVTPATESSSLDYRTNQTLNQIGSFGPFPYSNENAYQQALNNIASAPSFSYSGTAPIYNNAYAAQQQAALDAVLNREDFNWSKETDPQWSSYKKSYLREGDRATANALAQASAASGGMPSSYAVNAAAQAGDYYAAQLNDIIPTLYQQAYDRYLNEYQMKLSDLNAINTQEQLDYSRYLTDLGQYNTDRNFALQAWNANNQQALNAYNALLSDRGQAYNEYLGEYEMLQNYLGNLQQQSDTLYNRQLTADQYADAMAQQELENAMALAQLGAAIGDYSGYAKLGLYPALDTGYYDGGYSGGYGGGGSGSGSSENGAGGGPLYTAAAHEGSIEERKAAVQNTERVAELAEQMRGGGSSNAEIRAMLDEAFDTGTITQNNYIRLQNRYPLTSSSSSGEKSGSGSRGGKTESTKVQALM